MNNLEKVKLFFRIAKPSKLTTFLQFFFYMAAYLLNVVVAYPSANAITCLTVNDLNGTVLWLCVTCGIVVIQQVLLFIINRLYYRAYGKIWDNINSQIYDKVSTASQESFLDTSKEKIINVVYNNTGTLGEFPDSIAKYASYFVQAVVSICILLSHNIIIGAAIILVCVIIYFTQNYFNKRIGYWQDKYYDEQDKSLEKLTDSVGNHDLTKDLDLTDTMRKKYLKHLDKAQNHRIKTERLYSVTENWVPFAYHVIITLLSIYMVVLTKSNVFTLTLYLVLTNYLTQSITQMTSSYTLLDYVNSAHVACLRVKNILEMKPEDLIEYGNNSIDEIQGDIVFTNTSYQPKPGETTCSIQKFNLSIKENSTVLIYGAPSCGKRAIFHMINRSIRPTTGTITIDQINIYDFDKEAYKHNVAVASSKEYFYNDSIMNNLLLSGANKSKIYAVCKELGIHQKIISTQNSYASNLTKEKNLLSSFETYLLGVARAICTNSEIIVFYEFPTGLSTEQKETLKNLILKLKEKHTVLVFSHNNWAKEFCDCTYKVEKGIIKKESKK